MKNKNQNLEGTSSSRFYFFSNNFNISLKETLTMQSICYSNCSTCSGLEKILNEKGLSFLKRDIKEENPSADEMKKWHEKSGLPLKKFFNTSGMVYRELKLKDKLSDMSEEEQYALLATDGMLVKRPILITDKDEVLVGPLVKEYVAQLKTN